MRARRLDISPHTVNTHLRHVLAKLGVPNRVALAPGGASLDRVMSSPLATSTIGRVQPVAFAVSLLSGQAEADRVALASCWAGARKETYQDARCRAAIIREAVRIQPDPGGDVAVVYLEADDLAIAFTTAGDLGGAVRPLVPWPRPPGPGHRMDEAFTAPEPVPDYGTSRIWPAYSFDTKEYP